MNTCGLTVMWTLYIEPHIVRTDREAPPAPLSQYYVTHNYVRGLGRTKALEIISKRSILREKKNK